MKVYVKNAKRRRIFMYDIEAIKQQFKEVITHSQFIDDPKVDKLFYMW